METNKKSKAFLYIHIWTIWIVLYFKLLAVYSKVLQKSINGLYRFEHLVVIDLSRVDKNNMINKIWNDKNDTIW